MGEAWLSTPKRCARDRQREEVRGVPFQSGLELAVYSLFEQASAAASLIKVIEGPESIDQLTLETSTIVDGELTSWTMEATSDLISTINSAARQGNNALGLIGRRQVEITGSIVRDQSIEYVGSVYPSATKVGDHLVEIHLGSDQVPFALMTGRLLNEGLLGTAVVVSVCATIAFGGAIWWDSDRRNKKAVKDAMERCVTYEGGARITVRGMGTEFTADGKSTVHKTT
jgi:hypothetical protein